MEPPDSDMVPSSVKQISDAHHLVKRLARFFKPYHIFPSSNYHPINRVPAIQAVATALRNARSLSGLGSESNNDRLDVLDDLQATFCFQKNNVENTRRQLLSLIGNIDLRVREGPPDKPPPSLWDDASVEAATNKLLKNYKKWCKFLGIRNNIRLPKDDAKKAFERKLLYMGTYLFVWKESSNLRLMPECICYIYHYMAKELNQILDKEVNKETGVLIKPTYIGKSEAFLEGVVAPIYQTIVKILSEEESHGTYIVQAKLYCCTIKTLSHQVHFRESPSMSSTPTLLGSLKKDTHLGSGCYHIFVLNTDHCLD
ncbi:callose synthase 1-like [Raphanus sativus]|uniref:Callose synthase 1-like n=1 Tax=Raphanus sativus TaxID=3726 RepID=A0A6J0JJ06_RAPSA|nr:callose synthase 1-like [Raphanus sativus]